MHYPVFEAGLLRDAGTPALAAARIAGRLRRYGGMNGEAEF